MASQFVPVFADQLHHTLTTIAQGDFGGTEAALKTYASSITDRVAEGRARGVNVEFYGFVDEILSRAIDQGLGDEELSAVVKLWR
ncbi:MAG: hypothetical protein AAF480_12505 [Actinomycetota bacterium]